MEQATKKKGPGGAAEVLERVETEAKARAKPDAVVYATMAPGDVHRQGDIYIERLEEVPERFQKVPYPFPSMPQNRRQLAEGDGQGSRHCIKQEHTEHVVFYAPFEPGRTTALDGPVFEAKKAVEIEHPEHGHVTVPPGAYKISYQRQYAEDVKRVMD